MARNTQLQPVVSPELPRPLAEYKESDLRSAVKLSPALNPSALRFFDATSLLALDGPGFFVRDNFTAQPSLAAAVHDELARLHAEGKLARTRMVTRSGDGTLERWEDTSVRGDKNLWLNNKQKVADLQTPNLSELLFKMNELRKELNEACEFASQSVQAQAAVYENGAGYAKHLDATRSGTARRITCLYYCNPTWKPGDGGELRIFLDGSYVDVAPIADRLLVFQSATIEHQVLPAHQPRYAVTMWFY